MRKTVLATTVALLALLALAGAALGVGLSSVRNPDGTPPGDQAPATAMPARAHFVPLGVRLTGSAVVNGHVSAFNGSAISDAYVYWEAPYDSTWEWGETYTDASGAYSFANLPAASGTGYLYVSSPTDPWYAMWRTAATWADPGTTTLDWRPGVIPTELARGDVWNGWYYATTYFYGSDALSSVAAATDIWDPTVPSSYSDYVSRESYAPAGTYSTGATYFWMDQGLEFPTTQNVTAGASTGAWVAVDQNDAQRVYVTTPYWGSGKPGTVAKVRHWNYPAGWLLDYYGYPQSPSGTPYKEYADATTTGADPFTKSFTIPTKAPAGYWYVVGAYNASGVLDLQTPFQVCTLKSTKTAVRKGGSIKLSGVIPTEGHWGSTPGKTKYVTIYKRTKSVSAAPTAWDATKKGWTKVARVKANGYGKYASGYLRPTRTTWYVVRYPGDDWYWDAYTSVLKVRVY